MSLFKVNTTALPAEVVLGDKSKVSKERLVVRVDRIKQALEFDRKCNGNMSEEKKQNLKNEVKGILVELGARDEALDEIVKRLTV